MLEEASGLGEFCSAFLFFKNDFAEKPHHGLLLLTVSTALIPPQHKDKVGVKNVTALLQQVTNLWSGGPCASRAAASDKFLLQESEPNLAGWHMQEIEAVHVKSFRLL